MRKYAIGGLAIVLVVLALAASPVRHFQSGGPQVDAISRTFSFGAGAAGPLQAISRQYSVATDFGGVAISRQFTVATDFPGVAISRAVSFSTPAPDLVFELSSTFVPREGTADQPFQIHWRVRNTGSRPAIGPWTDRVEFSTSIRPTAGPASTTFPLTSPTTLASGASYERELSFLMPSTATPFTVALRTDSTSVIAEGVESNNVFGPQSVTVNALPRPNLRVVVTANPPSNPVADDFVALSFRVWNNGQAPTSAPSWIDRVFLVRDVAGTGIPPADESGFVASWGFPNISYLLNDPGGTGGVPGTSYERVAAAVQLPENVAGSYFVAVRTDSGVAPGAQVETSELDNLTFSNAFTIQPAPRPDFQVGGIALQGVAAGTPLPSGTAWTVAWQLQNRGPANYLGGSITTEIWVSANQQVTGAGALVGDLRLTTFTEPLPAMGVGVALLRSHPIVLPPDLPIALPSTSYAFKVRLDPQDSIAEAETVGSSPYWNNLAPSGTYPILVSSTPDLTATAIAPVVGSQPPQAAHPMEVTWTVTNPQSPGWNVPLTWRDQVWLSMGDANLDAADTLIGTFAESTVQAAGLWTIPTSYTKTTTTALPSSTPAGTYYLILVTDSDDDVFELDGFGETNNQRAGLPFPIERHPADLAITAQVGSGATLPPAQGAPGQSISLPWTVTNGSGSGLTSVSSWTDRVYLSPSQTNLNGAVQVLEQVHTGALAPGATYSQLRTATVPYVAPSASWLHFVTDSNHAVFEDGAIANNTVVTPFQVTNVVADLVVDQVAASRMRVGAPVTVTWTVHNIGPAATGATSWIDTVLLSSTQDGGGGSTTWTLGSWLRSAALPASSSYPNTRTFDLPLGLTPGPWYVLVRTDSANQVFEGLETNNSRSTRTQLDIEPPPHDGGGGNDGGPPSWVPANLIPRNVQIVNSPVTAGQTVQLSWDLANEGIGATSSSVWSDSVYLSIDSVLDPTDQFLGFHLHTELLGAGDVRTVTDGFTVPLTANAAWIVIVRTDAGGAVFQNGATLDDTAASAALLHVVTPPLTNLDISAVTLPSRALLGEALDFDWTTRNSSPTAVPAAWDWTNGFWLVPDGEIFPSAHARFLGQIASNAGAIAPNGGTHTQSAATAGGALTVPAVTPGLYRLVAQADALAQIAELSENDNVTMSPGVVYLHAIQVPLGGSARADLPNGASRWFQLSSPADLTIDLEFAHDDPNSRCEVFVRETTPPSLGAYDLSAPNLDAIDAHTQTVRIPRTSGSDYFILARTVTGAGSAAGATLSAVPRAFGVADVAPATVGAGVVTIGISGSELWRASAAELRVPGSPSDAVGALETAHLADGTLLARFDLTGVALGARELAVIDTVAHVETSWGGLVTIEPAAPLSTRVELDLAPNVRRGETGLGRLRLRNTGNVDVPYAAAALGHLDRVGAVSAAERLVIGAPASLLPTIESNAGRNSLVAVVEDLGPGQSHELGLELAVGANYSGESAALAVSCTPVTKQAFIQGPLTALSHALRTAVAADPSTPALLSVVAQNAATWDAAVGAGIASGAIDIDLGSIHTPDVVLRSARDLVRVIADGLAQQLALPAGTRVPASAIDDVASNAWCIPFVGSAFDCDGLFTSGCAGQPASGGVTVQASGNLPIAVVCMGTPAPDDPNEKLHPPGLGPDHLVTSNQPIRYEVHFENQASATAWASRVEILDEFEPGFRTSSLRFDELRIGRTTIPFAPNTSSFVGQVPLAINDTTSVLCQVSALVDASAQAMRVVLQALDPTTGLPSSSGNTGLLPPSGPGAEILASGYIAFSVRADELSASPTAEVPSFSGLRRRNTTRIQLNAAPPLLTNTTENLLDGEPPASSLVVDAVDGTHIHLSWSADDSEPLLSGPFPGAGVHGYSLYVAPSDHGPWTALLTDTAVTSYVFTASMGTTNGFKLEATDNVGNSEAKTLADVVVELPPDCNGNGVADAQDIAAGTATDINHNGVPDSCECIATRYCESTVDSNGHAAVLLASGLPTISGGNLSLRVVNASPSSRGVFIYGDATQQIPLGDGFFCVTGNVVRVQPLVVTSPSGSATLLFGASAVPIDASTSVATMDPAATPVGITRYFQFLFRDLHVPGGTGLDLTNGVRLTFCQ